MDVLSPHADSFSRRPVRLLPVTTLILVCLFCCSPAAAWTDLEENVDDPGRNPAGVHVLDGSYVMNAGNLHVNITNHGLIGSQYSVVSSFADAPSGQYPAGSGVEYLWSAGLWIGAVKNGERSVSTGQYQREFRPPSTWSGTIYESRHNEVVRPKEPGASGFRFPERRQDDDEDGLIDEEVLNGLDDDGDGRIDEDYGHAGDQMMVCTMFDDTELSAEIYPDHRPLGLRLIQRTFAWHAPRAEDFVGLEYEITNVGGATLSDVYLGILADCDIGPRTMSGVGQNDLAGSWDGWVQVDPGHYAPVHIAYMYDGEGPGHVPGYFGVAVLEHPFRAYDRNWADDLGIHALRIFAGDRPFENGGHPTNDEERYATMSREVRDKDRGPGDENDYAFLVTSGPIGRVDPGDTFFYRVALVAGDDLYDMIENAAYASQVCLGIWQNLDRDPSTGRLGRESLLCLSDFRLVNGHWTYEYRNSVWMDTRCARPIWSYSELEASSFEYVEEHGEVCAWVNLDNCMELYRGNYMWLCGDYMSDFMPDDMLYGCTGVKGREKQRAWVADVPPPTPTLRLWPRNNAVHLFWDDSGERSLDDREHRDDFESYRIWRADNWDRPAGSSTANGPPATSWTLLDEFDVINDCVDIMEIDFVNVLRDTMPMGPNTGLDTILYVPRILSDPQYDGLAAAMQQWVDRDTMGHTWMPPVLDEFGLVNDGMDILVPWAEYPAALDTFFLVTAREGDPATGVPPKLAHRFYEYIDHEAKNGFLYFYSVTTRDHVTHPAFPDAITGYGESGSPRSFFAATSPATEAVAADLEGTDRRDIFVYPNPATREALGEFQEMYPNAEDPTGVRIRFANLPQARNTIKIFTLSGDLVQEIAHDGSDGYGEASWNLVSRNGQQIVSGIYLYTVDSDVEDFEKTIGKFVVIR